MGSSTQQPEPDQTEPGRRGRRNWLLVVLLSALIVGAAVSLIFVQAAENRVGVSPAEDNGPGTGEREPRGTDERGAAEDERGAGESGQADTRESAQPESQEMRSSVSTVEGARREEAGERERVASELEAEVREISARYPGEYGVVVWQPSSGTRVSTNPDESFGAASLAKLPVMLALYRDAARERVDLEQRIEMSAAEIRGGTGAMRNQPPGSFFTLRECTRYLMQESDNTAWRMLDNYLGNDRIRSEVASAGAGSTNYEVARHSTTPDDTLKMLERISDPGYTSPQLSQEMLASMTDTSFENWLPQGLPPEASISHKIGILGGTFGDAGIVFPPKGQASAEPYYVVMLSKETTEPAASGAMQEVSLAAYRSLVDPDAEPRSAENALEASSDAG